MSFATMATLALGGAALGAIANPEDREKGALMGLGAGLLAPVAAPGCWHRWSSSRSWYSSGRYSRSWWRYYSWWQRCRWSRYFRSSRSSRNLRCSFSSRCIWSSNSSRNLRSSWSPRHYRSWCSSGTYHRYLRGTGGSWHRQHWPYKHSPCCCT